MTVLQIEAGALELIAALLCCWLVAAARGPGCFLSLCPRAWPELPMVGC